MKTYWTNRKGIKRQVYGWRAVLVWFGIAAGWVAIPVALVTAYALPVLLLTDASLGTAVVISLFCNLLATLNCRLKISFK